jgi:Xaa-Pro aminopeptidase
MNDAATTAKPIPFDTARLDALMDAAGLDVLVATSKHNIQYLLGGYRFFFFETMEAAGISRYLAAVIYQRGRPENAAYIGCDIEKFESALGRFWVPNLDLGWIGSKIAATRMAAHVAKLGAKRIGIEEGFLPADADRVLRETLAGFTFKDATLPLESLRAVKTAAEIEYLREASERVTDAMKVTFAKHCRPGVTKAEVLEAMKREEVQRGLVFDYLLMTAGTSLNRTPHSDQRLAAGDIMSLDSGGNYRGYIGDLCRMGIIGDPDQELVDLLGWIDEVQLASRRYVRPGARGGDCWDAGHGLVMKSPHAKYSDFIAHGMGLVTHEAPRLMNNARWSYDGADIERSLEAGMCLSLETTMRHPKRGFIKLEDTVLVTATGCIGLGDGGRGWNPAGTA